MGRTEKTDRDGVERGQRHQETEVQCWEGVGAQANEQAMQLRRKWIVENSCFKVEMREAPVGESIAPDGEGHRLPGRWTRGSEADNSLNTSD